jgi:hypothetical protein
MHPKPPNPRPTQRQAACHEWVTDGGHLAPVPLCGTVGGGALTSGAQEQAATGAGMALTAWVHQVKQAVPLVEERLFKRGDLLIRQVQELSRRARRFVGTGRRQDGASQPPHRPQAERHTPLYSRMRDRHVITSDTSPLVEMAAASSPCNTRREGEVPAGLFLIVKGTCEILHGGLGPEAGGGASSGGGPGMSGCGARAGGGAAQDFADRLSDSDDYEGEYEGEDEEDEGAEGADGRPLSESALMDVVALDLEQGSNCGVSAGGAQPWAARNAWPSGGVFAHPAGSPAACAAGGGSRGEEAGGFGVPAPRRRRLSLAHVSKLIGRIAGGPAPSAAAPAAAALVGGGGVLGLGLGLLQAQGRAAASGSFDGAVPHGGGCSSGHRGHRRAVSVSVCGGGLQRAASGTVSSVLGWAAGLKAYCLGGLHTCAGSERERSRRL